MIDTRPPTKLNYIVKKLSAHDGDRFVAIGWEEYSGTFLMAPEFSNACYDRWSAVDELKELAKKNNCILDQLRQELVSNYF